MQKGKELRKANDFAGARDVFLKATKVKPKDSLSLTAGGECEYRLEHYDSAIKLLSRAIALAPQEGSAYNYRYHSYIQLKDYEKALVDCKKCITLMPNFFVPKKDLVTLYKVLGRRQEARETELQFRQADKVGRARQLMMREKYKDAIALLDTQIGNASTPSQRCDLLQLRAECFMNVKDIPSARKDLDECIRLQSAGHPGVHMYRGLVAYSSGNYKAAIQDFTVALDTKSRRLTQGVNFTRDEVFYKRASAYVRLKEYRKAIADYDKILELDSTQARAYKLRGDCRRLLGEFQLSISDYNQAIENDKSNSASAYFGRSLAYEKLGNLHQAQTDKNRALEQGYVASETETAPVK